MEAFVMEVAGLAIRVQPMFETTKEYCKAYLSQSEPTLFVEITEEDLAYEQEMAEKEALEEGLRIRKFTGPFLERASIQRQAAEALLCRDTLLLHGSAVAVDGKAYLFTAPCGTGKSTHTRYWREVFGERAIMINDDKPFLHLGEKEVIAYGSPWSGKHGLGANVCMPLAGICILSRGKENSIQPADPERVLPLLLHQCYGAEDPKHNSAAEKLVGMLMERVPLWEMACTKDPQAAVVAYEAMSGQ